MLGITSAVYLIIQYRLIYNNFWKHERYFVNGYLDTVLIVLIFIGVNLIIVETLALVKL